MIVFVKRSAIKLAWEELQKSEYGDYIAIDGEPDNGPIPKDQKLPRGSAQIDAAHGVKFDQGKPKMGLISSLFLIGLSRVLTFGAKKYAAHNWRKGMPISKFYDALQRHLVDWNDGKNLDEETGLSLLDHAACELMFLRETVERRPDLDDRWKS